MREANDFECFREDEWRGRQLNYFEGFGEHERRGRQLNWFRGFGAGMVEETDEGMNERGQVDVEANEGARGGTTAANDRIREGMNAEYMRARRGGEVRGRVRGGRGRVFRGRRTRCGLCGTSVSYANLARHERTHRVWDLGGEPHPA